MKRLFNVFILSFCVSASVAANPLSAIISLHEGDVIFGNGKMQSKVSVKLMNHSIQLDDYHITLKEYGTENDLAAMGWKVSEIDNGFDHSYKPLSDRTQKMIRTNEDAYKVFYISTENVNSNIHICFTLTEKKSKKVAYNTCRDHGFERGTIEIYSKRPYRFTIADFVETKKVEIFRVRYKKTKQTFDELNYLDEIVGYSFGIKPRSSVPRDFKFKYVDEQTDKFKMKRSNFVADRRYAFARTSYSETPSYIELYFFETNPQHSSIDFSVYDIQGNKNGNYKVFSTGAENILNILKVDYFNDSFMLDDMHCYDPEPSNFNEKYKCYKTTSSSSSYYSAPKDDTTWDKMYNQYEVKIKLQDNFGSEHTLLIQAF